MAETILIVQARLTGGTRLPRKVLRKISSYSAIELLYLRLMKAKKVSKIVFAIPDNSFNDELYDYLIQNLHADVFRGSEEDVLSRYFATALNYPAEHYVRITGDCPLICAEFIDDLIIKAKEGNIDYISNVLPPLLPDGMDVEVFSSKALHWLNNNVTDLEVREHVTFGLRKLGEWEKTKTGLKIGNYTLSRQDTSWMRLTLDTKADLEVFQKVAQYSNTKLCDISLNEIERIYQEKELYKINAYNKRDEALKKFD